MNKREALKMAKYFDDMALTYLERETKAYTHSATCPECGWHVGIHDPNFQNHTCPVCGATTEATPRHRW